MAEHPTERLPLFPLGTVLVPGEVLPLRVFEPRYRQLVGDLVPPDPGTAPAATRSEPPHSQSPSAKTPPAETPPAGAPQLRTPQFGVVAIRQGHEGDAHALDGLYDIGCSAEILQVDRHPDGSSELVTIGRRRFRLDGLEDAATPYLTGAVRWLDEPVEPVDPHLVEAVRAAFAEYCDRLGGVRLTSSPAEVPDPTLLSYVVTGSMLLHLAERQQLLAAQDAGQRLSQAARLLHRERHLWQVVPSIPAVDLGRLPADPR
ncbi:MAG: LON peptidase substrate-binding domain-containing protein [Angustibacter sp.]